MTEFSDHSYEERFVLIKQSRMVDADVAALFKAEPEFKAWYIRRLGFTRRDIPQDAMGGSWADVPPHPDDVEAWR